MRNNNSKGRKDKTGGAATHPVAAPPDYTTEQRATVGRGLRILAKIIARAHPAEAGGTEQRSRARPAAGRQAR